MIGKILNSRYHIIRQLGQGGFGATFIAEDRWQDNKNCVIKQLKPDVLSPATQYLFEKEAEFLFKLGSHNQIPQLLAHFQEDGVFYIVQELIEGNDLNQEIKRGQRLGETQVIKLLIEILEVLEYVHQNQVIHRDIKPANIIRRRDGKIVLIDFGGIKQVRAISSDSTLITAIVGTPGYMPIEQFNNDAQFCSDIHAVGMIGIFALTGINPNPRQSSFLKSPQGETLWQDKAKVNPQLADIIDKMIKFDYRQRYQSATEVIAALKSLIYSPQLRSPCPTITLATLSNTKDTIPTTLFAPSDRKWRCIKTLESHSDSVISIVNSPDGEFIAGGSRGKQIKLWQLSTGKEIRTLKGHSHWVFSVKISPDGQLIASGSLDKTIKLWEVSTGREIRTLKGHSNWVFSVQISPDGQMIASGSLDKTIKLWEVSTGREIRTLKGHLDSVWCVIISPDGQILASSSGDKTIKLWEVSTGREICTLKGHLDSVWCVIISPDGQILASSSGDKTIKLWQLNTGREIRTLTGHSESVNYIAISPDGQILASASADHTIKLWQLNTGKEISTLTGDSDAVFSVAFSPDGETLVTGSYDKTIKLWQQE